MTKWIIGIGVLIIVGLGLWWSGIISSLMPSTPTPIETATTTANQNQQAAQTPPAPINDLPTQVNDASDAAIVQDSAALDMQLQSLTSDSANIDSSLNDKPVTQEF